MSDALELRLRTASAYGTAHQALEALERLHVWPTAINYELALHYVGDPTGPLAQAVEKMVADGDVHSDEFSDTLAREFLPRMQLQAELSDAGGSLTRQLERVGEVLDQARLTHAEVAGSMSTAGAGLASVSTVAQARTHVRAAAEAIQTAEARASEYKAQLDASAAEVGELRRHLDRIQRDALTDPLTGLGNRRAFEQDLDRALAECGAAGDPVTLAMIDIDHFKSFNDTWGHQTGDQVIRFIAGEIRAAAAPPRMAARYGGEEFAVVLPREGARAALVALEALRFDVASRRLRRRSTGEELGQVTVSVGVAQALPGEAPDALIERADAALYASKRSGRNRVTCSPVRLAA